MNKFAFTIILLLFGFFRFAYAQDFKYEAKLEQVEKTDFYKINISPKIVSAMENFPADIRIFDELNNEIPYLFYANEYNLNIETLRYNKFKKVLVKNYTDKIIIEIDNSDKNLFSLFYIMFKRLEKLESITLYGGNKKGAKMKLISINKKSFLHNKKGNTIELLHLSPCRYKYFEIHINNNYKRNRIIVSKVGYIKLKIPDKSFVKILKPQIFQTYSKEDKVSQIKITYNYAQRIDFVKINISQSDYYYRDAYLQTRERSVKKKRNKYFFRQIKSFKLNSDCLPLVQLNNFREKTFFLKIMDKDNLPLKIDSIECFQKKYYLVAKIEKNKSYFLRCGNSTVNTALYDLQYFVDEIPKHLKNIKVSEIKQLNEDSDKASIALRPDKNIIWFAISIIVFILLYITAKMLKNIDN